MLGVERLAAYVTHRCIALHVHAYPLHLLQFDAGEDGRVCSFAEEQRIAWDAKQHRGIMSAEGQRRITGDAAIKQTVHVPLT